VSRTVQQLVAGYVALCLALAGTVGISPVLHQWIEHAGQGHPHLHIGGQSHSTTAVHHHDQGEEHAHEHGQAHEHYSFSGQPAQSGLFVHNVRGIETSQIASRLWRWIADAFDPATTANDPPPDSDEPGHEHHSLAQLLASGLVELNLDLPFLDAAFLPVTFGSVPIDALLLPVGWDAQTASRGPPAAC